MSAHAMRHVLPIRTIRPSALPQLYTAFSQSPRFIRAGISSSSISHVASSRRLISSQTRQFTSSTILQKKKDKSKKSNNDGTDQNNNTGVSTADPFDLTQLHNGIADALARLKDDLQKLRSGGRFNPETIENLRVSVNKNTNQTVKLGEVAQVVPKGGRAVAIIVGEEDLVKPVNSAIVASNLSLTPQPDAHNSLQLNVPIPPPTKESREQAVKTAKAAMDKASAAVKSSRATVHKRLQDMQKKKEARPDDVRRAHDQMEKVVEKAQKDIKDVFETARKGLEQA